MYQSIPVVNTYSRDIFSEGKRQLQNHNPWGKTVAKKALMEDSQIDFYTQSVLWMLGGGVLRVDALKISEIDF